MDARDRQNDQQRNASTSPDEQQGTRRTPANADRDDLERARERHNKPALTRREREERWPIG